MLAAFTLIRIDRSGLIIFVSPVLSRMAGEIYTADLFRSKVKIIIVRSDILSRLVSVVVRWVARLGTCVFFLVTPCFKPMFGFTRWDFRLYWCLSPVRRGLFLTCDGLHQSHSCRRYEGCLLAIARFDLSAGLGTFSRAVNLPHASIRPRRPSFLVAIAVVEHVCPI